MSRIGWKTPRGGRSSALWIRSLLAVCTVAAGLQAQTTTGSIIGLVTDSGGAIVPNSALTLTNRDTNQTRKQAVNETGAYTFTALPPGNYRLELEHPGFKRFVQEPVVVRVQQTVTANLVLEVGQVNQTIEVAGRPELLDAATSSLSQVVEN